MSRIDFLEKYATKDKHYDINKEIDKALNSRSDNYIYALTKHPDFNIDHTEFLLNHKNKYFHRLAYESKHITPEHIDKALDDVDSLIKGTAISNPNASIDNISKALLDEHYSVRKKALQHPNVTNEHIDIGLSDPDEFVRAEAARHAKLPLHINKALSDHDWIVRRAATENMNIDEKQLKQAMIDSDRAVSSSAYTIYSHVMRKK